MCPKLPLVGVHAQTLALGRSWCDKPDKKLEKNSDPHIIEREREKKVLQFVPQNSISNVPKSTSTLV